ncbi:hypothetical protein BUALT_Bualt14G0032000 [Buddleja alternifolia]|uniref:J domain-containing protein n=1 Tax=Buddleja alternifolia TaxID=168488 RepID=A0AAV6WFU6_9LAMI|nr:hypothetical protein BUALT_Bualt14G0032000 [Buddleja alternifolia]
MCSYGVQQQLRPLRFSFPHSTRPANPPQLVSFRIRPVPAIRSSLNDTVSLHSERPAMSFYELLGIPETGSLLEIKQAYKQLARKYHPDVSPPGRVEEYTQTFILVQEAYETLSDPMTRELYDRDMAKGIHLAFTARRRSKFDEGRFYIHAWSPQASEPSILGLTALVHRMADGTRGMDMRREMDGVKDQLKQHSEETRRSIDDLRDMIAAVASSVKELRHGPTGETSHGVGAMEEPEEEPRMARGNLIGTKLPGPYTFISDRISKVQRGGSQGVDLQV